MAQQNFNTGNSANDGTGEGVRDAFIKQQAMNTELYGLADNKIRYKYAYVDFNDSTNWGQQIADYLNNNQFNGGIDKAGNELIYIYTYKYVSGNPTDPNQVLSVVRYEWRFNRGKGNYGYGTSNNLTFGDFNLVSIFQENPNNTITYDLGTQTSTTVEDVVNATGPYVIPFGSIVKFKINLDGDDQTYIYVGEDNTSVGNGATQVTSADFVLTGGVEPAPPNPTDYVTQSELENSFYAKAEYLLTDFIANAVFDDADFYVIETDNDVCYFAVKQGTSKDFRDSKIYFTADGDFDLGDVYLVKDGYNVFELGTVPSSSFGNGNNFFDAWNIGKKNTVSSLTEQEIDSGGNYTDLELTGNVLVFTNQNAQAILSGMQHDVFKEVDIINQSDYVLQINNTGNIKPPNDTGVGIEGSASLIYSELQQKWLVVGLFASKSRPEWRGLTSTKVMVVNDQAESEVRDIVEPIVYRPAQSTPMSKADLNAAYPNAETPFEVICSNTSLLKRYTLLDNTTKDWGVEDLTLVT